MNENLDMQIKVIRQINDEDELVKKALTITRNFKVLTHAEAMEILEPKLSMLTVKK